MDLFHQRLERRLIPDGDDDKIRWINDSVFRQKGTRRLDARVAGLYGLLSDGQVGSDDDVNVTIRNLVAHDGTPVEMAPHGP